MTTGNKIRHLRKAAKMTQTELGNKLGVKKNAVSKWECGRVDDIPAGKIKAMAALFDVPVSYLIDDEDPGSANAAYINNLGPLSGNSARFQILEEGKFLYPDFVVIGPNRKPKMFCIPDSLVDTAWNAVVSLLMLNPEKLETAARLIEAL